MSQTFFLLLFIFFIFQSEYRGTFENDVTDIHLDYPVQIFLEADPLVGITTAIASHTLFEGLKWCIPVLILSMLFGRFICGWVCPLGTLNHLTGTAVTEKKKSAWIKENRYRESFRIKYIILIVMLGAATCTSLLTGFMDPIALLTRSLVTSVIPALTLSLRWALDSLSLTNMKFIQRAGDILYNLADKSVLSFTQPHFHRGYIIGIIFITILLLNRRMLRFWCRILCPLGALLGAASWFSIFGMEKKNEKCTDCNLCLVSCQGACEPIGRVKWRASECHMCFNCRVVCPEDVIRFKVMPKGVDIIEIPDIRRRKVITSIAAGLVIYPFARTSDEVEVNFNEKLIRPPGSLAEKDFLAKCIKCGQCMKVCPNNALHPASWEAGPEGIWTPVLIPRIGYCEFNCTLCTQVCPTGAIKKLTEAEKTGKNGVTPVRIGTAFYDRGRCLPWAMAIPCIVCEEWCPTPKKAIRLEKTVVRAPDGRDITVQQPYVIPELCIGCGACETKCPVQDKAAVYVTSIGETRAPDNQILLNPASPNKRRKS